MRPVPPLSIFGDRPPPVLAGIMVVVIGLGLIVVWRRGPINGLTPEDNPGLYGVVRALFVLCLVGSVLSLGAIVVEQVAMWIGG